jgi:hypothetical protein
MFNIVSYLERFKNFGVKETEFKEWILACVKEETGRDVSKNDVRVQGDSIFIKANPMLKSELFMKKGSLLGKINLKNSKTTIKDIR